MRARHQKIGSALFVLPVLWALLAGLLAYQLPFHSRIAVGEFGDRLFVQSSEAQDETQTEQGRWHVDQLDNPGRSRWSRARATITLPGLGRGRDLQVTLFAGGWPGDTLRSTPKQPDVAALVDQQTIAQFTPTSDAIAPFSVTIPAALQSGSEINLTLFHAATFTSTATYADPRQKGIRLDTIEVSARGWGALPDWRVLGGLGLATALAMGTTSALSPPRAPARRRRLVLLFGFGIATLGVTTLALWRLWLAALLPGLLVGLTLVMAVAHWRWLARCARGLIWRLAGSSALHWGLSVGMLLACGYVLALIVVPNLAPASQGSEIVTNNSVDRTARLLMRVSLYSGAVLALLASVTVLPGWVLSLRRMLLTGRLAAILLALIAGIWIGYETWLIASLPFIGHADYADNAVVARNLLRGRGWVVDYVSQFYAFVPGGSVTRPQETWPLLQPVLMLPAMAVLGPTPFAARVVNIVFMIVLTIMIYQIGARVWDRRVGLIGALLTLTNLLFFRLAIYTTSDLALVVWSMAAFWLVYRAVEEEQRTENTEHRTENREHRTENREHRTENREQRTQNTEQRTQNREHRTQNREHRAQNTEHRTQNQRSRAQIVGCWFGHSILSSWLALALGGYLYRSDDSAKA